MTLNSQATNSRGMNSQATNSPSSNSMAPNRHRLTLLWIALVGLLTATVSAAQSHDGEALLRLDRSKLQGWSGGISARNAEGGRSPVWAVPDGSTSITSGRRGEVCGRPLTVEPLGSL